MITSLAFIFLVGLSLGGIFQKLRIPKIIGMLLAGIILGPFVCNLLDPSILGISSELRKMALIIILIKAGITLDVSDLKKVGRPAILMAFLPAVMEIIAFVLLGPTFLCITRVEAAVIGAVLGAVSPAVVVPRTVMLMEKRYGTDKSIPQLIMAGASLDDVFVIVLFYTFVNMAQGGSASIMDFVNIPISIVLGILLGIVTGLILAWFFETLHRHNHTIRNSLKVIIVLGVAFLLMALEGWLEGLVSISGLLAIMAMACAFKMKSTNSVAKRLADKYGKLWLAAEVLLFVLVGAAVDVRYMFRAGGAAVLMIFIALAFRSVGVWICLLGTELNIKERCFCVISYLPKATVQAAIGGIPLALGLPCGNLVLSVAVLSIVITAPIGAFAMDVSYKKLLKKEA